MSNGDGKTTRKAHIVRIYKDDDSESGTWIDIERLDELLYEEGSGFPWQQKRWQFDWLNFNPNESPHKEIKDPKNKDSTIKIPVRDRVRVMLGHERLVDGRYLTRWQEYIHTFVNDETNRKRKTQPRRIYHYDIPDSALDGDKQPPRAPDNYLGVIDPATRDKAKHVDVEVLETYLTVEGRQWQEKRWLLAKEDPLLQDEFQPGAGGDAASDVGDSGIDPPYRLDPLQNIVNISWGGGSLFVTAYSAFNANHRSVVYTNEIKSKDDNELTNWNETFVADSTPEANVSDFRVSGWPGTAAYAAIKENVNGKPKPAFMLVGGSTDIYSSVKPASAKWLTSSNGKDWTQHDMGQGEFYALTWNEDDKAFYAGMTDFRQLHDVGDWFDTTFKSTDGVNWNQIDKTSQSSRLWNQSAPIQQYCSDKINDVFGQKVPTSVFGYDEGRDILIAPDPLFFTWGIAVPSGEEAPDYGTALILKRGPKNTDMKPAEQRVALPEGMDNVIAVAYAEDIWQAAGSVGIKAVVATSTDGGENWKVTFTEGEGSGFTAIAAGPSKDQN
jgi:hypothetical protein